MDVLVTGSSGAVGSAAVEGLSDRHEVTCLDQVDHPDHDTVVVDVRDYESIREHFDGRDAVIHAAQNPELNAHTTTVAWTPGLVDNLQMTTNVIRSAVEADLDAVVHCSSNHAVGMYEKSLAPELYELDDDTVIDHRSPPRPDSMYGVEKVYEEGLVKFAAEWHDLRGYSIRIGNLRPAGRDTPFAMPEAAVENGDLERGSEAYRRQVTRMRGAWISRRDMAHLFEQCVLADNEGFEVFYGVSDNDRRWFDIERAREVVGYDPQDNGELEEQPEPGELAPRPD